jgi:hypothetical protein
MISTILIATICISNTSRVSCGHRNYRSSLTHLKYFVLKCFIAHMRFYWHNIVYKEVLSFYNIIYAVLSKKIEIIVAKLLTANWSYFNMYKFIMAYIFPCSFVVAVSMNMNQGDRLFDSLTMIIGGK